MRHYLVGQTIHVISKVNPLRLLMTKPSSLNGRLAKWAILLSQYDMHFLPQKAIKGQAIADFMAKNPAPGSGRPYEDQMNRPRSIWPKQPLRIGSGRCFSMGHRELSALGIWAQMLG